MRMDELVKLANSQETKNSYTEKDALDFFKKSNLGHWPSEKGELELVTKNGKIILSIGKNMIGASHDLTPAGKMFLIKEFFKNHTPQAQADLEKLDDYKIKNISEKETIHPKDFHNRIIQRLSSEHTQFIKSGPERIAFIERKRINSDNSLLYSYDLNTLDKDKTSKFALVLPGLKTLVYSFEEYKNKIVRSVYSVEGRYFEDLEPWERAEYIAMTPLNIFNYQNVGQKQLDAAFLMTALYNVDELNN